MAKEYKVIVDQSLNAENSPVALEKKIQELGREGWELKHVSSVVYGSRDDLVARSRIYLFWNASP